MGVFSVASVPASLCTLKVAELSPWAPLRRGPPDSWAGSEVPPTFVSHAARQLEKRPISQGTGCACDGMIQCIGQITSLNAGPVRVANRKD